MGVIRRILDSRLAWALLLGALLWVGGRRAVEGLARDPRFFARPVFGGARGPAWGGDEVVRPLLARLEALGPVNLFDPDFDAKVRGALEDLPGVAHVHAIRRHWPDRYSVSVRLRRPVAVVHGREAVPVTATAVALPSPPYARASAHLLAVHGIRDAPPPLGEVWESEALADALATLRQLQPYWDDLAPLGLRAIDVAGAGDPRQGVVLRGADGITVRWGRPRAEVGENPVARKIAFLRIAARSLDRIRGYEIDVRYGSLYLRESPAQ